MSERGTVLYDPTAEPRTVKAALAPRLASLTGMRAGILDNSKANAGTLMLAVAKRLKRSATRCARRDRARKGHRRSPRRRSRPT